VASDESDDQVAASDSAKRPVTGRTLCLTKKGHFSLSQRAAAELCGLTFGEWQGLEDDRAVGRETEKAQKIARGLGVDLSWLLLGGCRDCAGRLGVGRTVEP